MITSDEILLKFAPFDLDVAENRYITGQAERLAYTGALIQRYRAELGAECDILDVGPHFLTRILADHILPKVRISTLGHAYPKLTPPELIHRHALIDMNECASVPLPFESATFDIIVICEMVEHLFIPPSVVFTFLKRLLKAPSGRLIVGTPNAVSISKRLKMMMGENPFQELSPAYRNGAAHIREYTMAELKKYGQHAGLEVDFEEYCNYWNQYLFPGSAEISSIERDTPMFRGGLTIVFKHV